MNVSLLKQIIKEELANGLKEATHPWYTSTDGYYAGERKAGGGPVHTGNVIDYLKPGTLVYNVNGDSKTIKSVTSAHIMFTDGTKDYFMNWFPQKPLSEESAAGAIGVGAGPIQTLNWVAPKGQKTNKATKTAIKQGFKKASGMPKNSKMLDYKELWKGKKSAMNEEKKVKRKIVPNKQKGIADKIEIASVLNKIIQDVYKESNLNNAKQLFYDLMNTSNINDSVKKRMIAKVQAINNKPALNSYLTNSLLDYEGLKVRESNYDMASPYGAPSGYTAASGYTGPSLATKEGKLQEVVQHIIKEELLNETSYNKFKNEVKYRTKNEMLHKSIREVKRKLEEVERLVEYTTRIKQELSENEDGVSYWKRSLKAINEISEVSNKISNKIKSIYQ
jgi:hypothetical protein